MTVTTRNKIPTGLKLNTLILCEMALEDMIATYRESASLTDTTPAGRRGWERLIADAEYALGDVRAAR